MDWSKKLNKICSDGATNLGDLCRAVKIELFSGVVSDTRVDTGRLRGNWQIQDDTKPEGTLDRLDKNGSVVNAEIEQESTPDGKTYFVNNLPYAKVYEIKDGMVARNVTRVKRLVNKMAKEMK